MKSVALADYLGELPSDEVAEIYEETPTQILRAFNCAPSALRDLIAERFPHAVPEDEVGQDENEDDEDEGEEAED